MVIPFWALMILFPKNKIVESPYIIVPPVLCYFIVLTSNITMTDLSLFRSASPEAMMNFLNKPWSASLVWIYAGAFDLFVGRWIFLDSKVSKINHYKIVPILFISIFLGPIGYLLYIVLKAVDCKKNN